jgi:hypothetical protein
MTNEYERQRDARIASNKRRLAELGIDDAVAALKAAIDAAKPKPKQRKPKQKRILNQSDSQYSLRHRGASIKPVSYFEPSLSPLRKKRSNQRLKRWHLRLPSVQPTMSDEEEWKELLNTFSLLGSFAEKLASLLVSNGFILSAVKTGEIIASDVAEEVGNVIDEDPDLKANMKRGHRLALETAIKNINRPVMSPGDASNNNDGRR